VSQNFRISLVRISQILFVPFASVVGYKAVAKTAIDLSKREDIADVEIRDYVSKGKDRKSIEFNVRRSSPGEKAVVGLNKVEDIYDACQRKRLHF
jgi:hypothetical protein